MPDQNPPEETNLPNEPNPNEKNEMSASDPLQDTQPAPKPGFWKRFGKSAWKFFLNKGFKIRTYPYICKIIGIWAAAVTFVITYITRNFINAEFVTSIRPFPEIFFIICLYVITMSKEKLEDEGVEAIRMKAYRFSYSVMMGILILTMVENKIFNDKTDAGLDLVVLSFQFIYLTTFTYLNIKRNKK